MLKRLSKRWCMVDLDEQHDLFVGDRLHAHLVEINLQLDVPLERTLCGDLLPSRPVYRELTRAALGALCPQCLLQAKALLVPVRRATVGPVVGAGPAKEAPYPQQQMDIHEQY